MKAYELIEQLDWCQGDYARNIDGADVAPENPNAVCFCSVGALQRVYGKDKAYIDAVHRLETEILKHEWHPFLSCEQVIVKWNDAKGRSKKEVVALMRNANV